MLDASSASNDLTRFLVRNQHSMERRALRLAAAWSDFAMVEHIAGEVVRRFGHIDLTDLGAPRAHRHPVFAAFQTACVITYVRPFIEDGGLGPISEDYCTYVNPQWNELHHELLRWQRRLTGEDARERQFIAAPEDAGASGSGRFVVEEATSVLEPLRHFAVLRMMCADRKALIGADLQTTLGASYPHLRYPVLLSLHR